MAKVATAVAWAAVVGVVGAGAEGVAAVVGMGVAVWAARVACRVAKAAN